MASTCRTWVYKIVDVLFTQHCEQAPVIHVHVPTPVVAREKFPTL